MILQIKTILKSLTFHRRNLSTNSYVDFLSGTVIFSKSRDIYRNLSFEDWIYSKIDFKNKHPGLLLMWWNRPAVIIGRHQNPWVECDLKVLEENNIMLVRRNSGGGTVYHDLGNLNCSFLTSRSKYKRRTNLEIMCKALQKWNFDVSISEREDIVIQGEYKISGTASKLGRDNAYHHCTVLISVKSEILKEVLNKNRDGIINKATESVKSKVINLQELYPILEVEDVAQEIAKCFHNFYGIEEDRVKYIYPNEEIYSGIEENMRNLKSWEWIYGRTPRFTLHKEFIVEETINLPIRCSSNHETNKLIIEVIIYHGKIENIYLKLSDVEICPSLKQYFCGICMKSDIILQTIKTWTEHNSQHKVLEKYVKQTLLSIFS
ncbi:lipoyltransferase 1, mitochondrial-like [Centruroides sculpturatus]|uniref:lipoyltransferase 1, mitochondrial-like n=1 Tax=Centruroides sculpturatus TaxID=218467 RepID=UPI000C6EFE1B|nr:lipoyltransferase 1, mitochondrial-like [Centruroides sculpturatus]